MIDSKFIKRVQSSVNRDRTMVSMQQTVSTGEIREYIYEKHTEAKEGDEHRIAQEIVQNRVQNHTALAKSEPREEGIEPVKNNQTTAGLSVPTQQSGMQTSQPSSSLGGVVEELLIGTQVSESAKVKDEIVEFHLNQAVNSALDLKQSLEKIRATEQALVTKVYTDHKTAQSNQAQQVTALIHQSSSNQDVELQKKQQELNQKLLKKLQEFGVSS